MNAFLSIATFLPALLAWSAQVVVLAGAGTLAAWAIASPKGRLALWQGLLLFLLLLPAFEPRRAAPAAGAFARIVTVFVAPAGAAHPSYLHWRSQDWLWLIAVGAFLRLLWIMAGFARLRRYRQQAQLLVEPPLRFASNVARWYVSDAVSGPVTYGWRRPVILLPSKTLDFPAAMREAIQCHELIHVQRCDWLFVVGETIVRGLLWFHPAIWFLLGRINLAREQAVDREAVRLLQSRDTYLDALVAAAAQHVQPAFVPAFLRKRQLLARVEAVIKETAMSRSRIAAGVAAACSILPLAAVAAMWLFPFAAGAQNSPDSPGVYRAGPDVTSPVPVYKPQPEYSEQAKKAKWGGTVLLSVVIGDDGIPRNIKVVKPLGMGLDEKAIEGVAKWRFKPGFKDGMPVAVAAQIEITFRLD